MMKKIKEFIKHITHKKYNHMSVDVSFIHSKDIEYKTDVRFKGKSFHTPKEKVNACNDVIYIMNDLIAKLLEENPNV